MIRPENVPVTVDIIIEMGDQEQYIVLVERKNPPHGWALPGGFVEGNESVADAARREAKEETGLDVELFQLQGVYSKPGRDPRGPVVSVCFVGYAKGTPKAADDAKNVRVFNIYEDELPPMAFDHKTVIDDYLNKRNCGKRVPLDR